MDELLIVLLPILLTDIVNPVLFAGVVYTLGSSRPIVNTWSLLLSFFFCYFVSGLIIAVGLEYFSIEFHIPDSFDYILEFLIAMLLFYMGYKQLTAVEKPTEYLKKKDAGLNMMRSLRLGMEINLVGLPLAIPYLAWIDQILKADLSYAATWSFLMLYNILYILPFVSLIGVHRIYRKHIDEILQTLNQWMIRIANRYMPILFIILGFLLLEDCVSYFLGYREYSFISLFK